MIKVEQSLIKFGSKSNNSPTGKTTKTVRSNACYRQHTHIVNIQIKKSTAFHNP